MMTVRVNTCEVTDCAYNSDKTCHALAITIGNPTAATCGTYTPRKEKGGIEMTIASVGACKVAECNHNKNLMCHAKEVRVGIEGGTATCLTFEKG